MLKKSFFINGSLLYFKIKFCTHQRPGRTKLLKSFHASVYTVYIHTTKCINISSTTVSVPSSELGLPLLPHRRRMCPLRLWFWGKKLSTLSTLCVSETEAVNTGSLKLGNFVKAASSYWSSCKVKDHAQWYSPQSTYRVEMKYGECIGPLSWSVHCNFVRDGKQSGGGGRAPHPPSPARADFSIMMDCMPEIGHCHSVCTLWYSLCYIHAKRILIIDIYVNSVQRMHNMLQLVPKLLTHLGLDGEKIGTQNLWVWYFYICNIRRINSWI